MRATYIDANDLANIILGIGPIPSHRVLVIDVRDSDFGDGGYIKGAVNIPVDAFDSDYEVDEIIAQQCCDKDMVVLHCRLSQQRGPMSARRLAERLEAAGRTEPTVHVLENGFKGFSRLFGGNPELVVRVA